MKISRKAEYALRAVAAMSRAPMGTNFAIQEIARAERIPLKFLEQILLVLKNTGLLRSRRGVGGGYQLLLPPAQITLRDVIYAIDGPFDPIACNRARARPRAACECGITGGCALGKTLSGLQTMVHAWLTSTSIADIIANDQPHPVMSFEI